MMQLGPLFHDIFEDSRRLIALLERHHVCHPSVAVELASHRDLYHQLEEQRRNSEQALAEWRSALARRWECEVAGQRLYLAIQRQLRDFFGPDAPYLQLIIPPQNNGACTATDLLIDLRRIEASLVMLRPQPSFTAEWLEQLAGACADLDAAIAWTARCETQRRNALLSQRLTYNAYHRARARTQRLLTDSLGEDVDTELRVMCVQALS